MKQSSDLLPRCPEWQGCGQVEPGACSVTVASLGWAGVRPCRSWWELAKPWWALSRRHFVLHFNHYLRLLYICRGPCIVSTHVCGVQCLIKGECAGLLKPLSFLYDENRLPSLSQNSIQNMTGLWRRAQNSLGLLGVSHLPHPQENIPHLNFEVVWPSDQFFIQKNISRLFDWSNFYHNWVCKFYSEEAYPSVLCHRRETCSATA